MRKVLFAALLASFSASLFAVDVTGKVEFLTKRGQKPTPEETIVWLDPIAASKGPELKSGKYIMATRNKTILPHVMVVPVGSSITFPNEDAITHNLFSVSKPNDFDLGLYKRGTAETHVFDKPGVVNVYCNVHPEMSAVVHVVSSPYYTSASEKGAFRLEGVPEGRYRLVAWNEVGGSVSAEILVGTAGVTGSTVLRIDGRKYRRGSHLNKEGKPYRRPRSSDY